MITRQYTAIALILILGLIGLNGCHFHDHHTVVIPEGDLEVQVVNAVTKLPMPGVEVTLYHSYDNAHNHRFEIARAYTGPFGAVIFPRLAGRTDYYVRAQDPFYYTVGSVYIGAEGLYVLSLELL